MNKVFWAVVAIDAALFIALLVIGLTAPAPHDGGREMGLIFGVILPGLLVAVAVLHYVFSKWMPLRVVALVIAAAPLLLIAAARLRSAWIDYHVRHNSADIDPSPARSEDSRSDTSDR